MDLHNCFVFRVKEREHIITHCSRVWVHVERVRAEIQYQKMHLHFQERHLVTTLSFFKCSVNAVLIRFPVKVFHHPCTLLTKMFWQLFDYLKAGFVTHGLLRWFFAELQSFMGLKLIRQSYALPLAVRLIQAFFFNTTWVHVRGECLPDHEFFPWVLAFSPWVLEILLSTFL